MGDDLIFAQKFTRTAADGLALLVEMEDPRSAPEASVVIDMMTTVQRGAKRLRARHIYSGAQDVLSALHHESDATLAGRIECLGSLMTEYARGLGELTAAQEVAPEKSPLDKWETARETLNAVLPIAPSGDADMLSRLMRAPVTLAGVQPEQQNGTLEADIIPLETAVTPEITSNEAKQAILNPVLETQRGAKTASAPKIDADISVPLDTMMRDVVAEALSVARTVERTISLSYDMGERSVTAQRAEDLTARLSQALSQIILETMTDDRVGHIDVNLAGEKLHILTGTTAVRLPIDPQSVATPKRLITPETEQGLRTQLNNLMDPISLHETAS